jgi:hypothetical protein
LDKRGQRKNKIKADCFASSFFLFSFLFLNAWTKLGLNYLLVLLGRKITQSLNGQAARPKGILREGVGFQPTPSLKIPEGAPRSKFGAGCWEIAIKRETPCSVFCNLILSKHLF